MAATNGKPIPGGRPLDGGMLATIERLRLRGKSLDEIGRLVGRHPVTVCKIIEKHLRPRWRELLKKDLEFELAKVQHLEDIAHQCLEESRLTRIEEANIYKVAKKRGADPELAERVVKKIKTVGSKAWAEVIQWCIDFRAKVAGHYQPEQRGGTTINVVKVVVQNRQQYLNVQEFIEKAKVEGPNGQ